MHKRKDDIIKFINKDWNGASDKIAFTTNLQLDSLYLYAQTGVNHITELRIIGEERLETTIHTNETISEIIEKIPSGKILSKDEFMEKITNLTEMLVE